MFFLLYDLHSINIKYTWNYGVLGMDGADIATSTVDKL